MPFKPCKRPEKSDLSEMGISAKEEERTAAIKRHQGSQDARRKKRIVLLSFYVKI